MCFFLANLYACVSSPSRVVGGRLWVSDCVCICGLYGHTTHCFQNNETVLILNICMFCTPVFFLFLFFPFCRKKRDSSTAHRYHLSFLLSFILTSRYVSYSNSCCRWNILRIMVHFTHCGLHKYKMEKRPYDNNKISIKNLNKTLNSTDYTGLPCVCFKILYRRISLLKKCSWNLRLQSTIWKWPRCGYLHLKFYNLTHLICPNSSLSWRILPPPQVLPATAAAAIVTHIHVLLFSVEERTEETWDWN